MFENWKKKREENTNMRKFFDYAKELRKHAFATREGTGSSVIPVKLKNYIPYTQGRFTDGGCVYAYITNMEYKYSECRVEFEYVNTNTDIHVSTIYKKNPDDLKDIIIPVTREEIESKTRVVMEELYENLRNASAIRYSGTLHGQYNSSPCIRVEDRSMIVADISKMNYGWSPYMGSGKYFATHELWGPKSIVLRVAGCDIHGNVYVNDLTNKSLTFISNEEFEKDDRTYLDQKTQEFRGVITRYAKRPGKGYVDVCKATVKKKYVYGDNDLFVEFELRHMNDETNEVQTLTMEFNKFRNEYPLDEDPAREMPRTIIDL